MNGFFVGAPCSYILVISILSIIILFLKLAGKLFPFSTYVLLPWSFTWKRVFCNYRKRYERSSDILLLGTLNTGCLSKNAAHSRAHLSIYGKSLLVVTLPQQMTFQSTWLLAQPYLLLYLWFKAVQASWIIIIFKGEINLPQWIQ